MQEDRRLEEMIEKMADKSPPWLAKFLRAFSPFVTVTFTVLNFVGPVLIKFYGYVYKVRAPRDACYDIVVKVYYFLAKIFSKGRPQKPSLY